MAEMIAAPVERSQRESKKTNTMAASSSTPNSWPKVARTTKVKKRTPLKIKNWNVGTWLAWHTRCRGHLWKCRGCPFTSRTIRIRCFFFLLSPHTITFSWAALFLRWGRCLFDLILKSQLPAGHQRRLATGQSLVHSGTAVAFGTNVTT